MDVILIHLAVDQCLAAFEMVYPDNAGAVEVTDFYGRDEMLAHLSFACAEMLSARTAGNAKRVAAFAHLLAIHIAEKYTNIASQRPDYRGGLPIARLRKIEDYVHAHLAESISIETLAKLVELSPFHFSRMFKQTTGMTPLQFVTRERIVRAQQLIRETSRSLIEIALEVGYTSPSHFAQVFRRVVGVAPTEFRGTQPPCDGLVWPRGWHARSLGLTGTIRRYKASSSPVKGGQQQECSRASSRL